MTRPELTYCNICGGVILPVDDAIEGDGWWVCTICDDDADPGRLWRSAMALEHGTYRRPRDPRDELDGGVR